MSAADGLVRNEEAAGATPATLTISDGWQSSNAPVPKTERAFGLRGCNPYTIRQFNPQPQETYMTIAQYLPRWLRIRPQKTVPQNPKTINKKEKQILPTLPKAERRPNRFQDDDSPPGFRILWRL